MAEMTDIERLIAIEDIKQLKARRDRAVDTKDWAAFEAMHAPDHTSANDGMEPMVGAAAATKTISTTLANVITIHHSHTPDITFESPTRAMGVWAMEDKLYWKQGDEEHWLYGAGFYHEVYEKQAGRWVFTWRRLERLTVRTSPGAVFPPK